MIDLPELYDHQKDLRDRTRAALSRHGRVILCAPPGMGKTRIAKWILGATVNRTPGDQQSGKSLFTVHRRGLVDNAIESFGEEPAVPHGAIMSGRPTSYGYSVQIASIDTLLNWFCEEDYPEKMTYDLIVWDEAHSHHPKLAKFLKAHDETRERLGLHPAYVIGLTATPQAKGLADVYGEIVNGPSTQWLIDHKYLAPFRYFRATQGKLGLLVKRGGEFTNDSVSAAMDGLSGDLVRDWKQFADGRPTVGFFPRRSHARDAQQKLEEAGVRVGYVDGETPDDERRMMYWKLNEHNLDYLCNVQVIERGTDIPRIGCVQLCVAIGSVVRYRQMIGRGSRTHPDKRDCLVLDHGANVKRHGLFEDDPAWILDISTKEPGEVGPRPTIECPKCQAIYRGGKCRVCGCEPALAERKAQGLEFDGSELKEYIPTEMAKSKATKAPEELMIAAIYKAGRSGRTWKQCVGIYYRANDEQCTSHKVPRTITVAGKRYSMVMYGSPDGGRRVSALYPFTVGTHGGPYLIEERETAGTPY